MLFRQQVKTVTHVVELPTFVQDRIWMHGVRGFPESVTAQRGGTVRKFLGHGELSTCRPGRRSSTALPRDRLLRSYGEFMEGRSDRLKRLNLGRSIDHSFKCSQHLRVGIGVVSFCIGLALPQTDGNNIQAAGI